MNHLSPGVGSPGEYVSQSPEGTKLIPDSELGATEGGAITYCYVHNKSGSARYLFIFDGTDATGTIIGGPYKVAAGEGTDAERLVGVKFTTGLFVALSSSDAAYSAATVGADGWFNVGWTKT